jgi:diketogulonate reductase-like aldo/keto reductase
MDAAIDAGINFFDTADVYGGPQSPDMKNGYGIAEETVGRCHAGSDPLAPRNSAASLTLMVAPRARGPCSRCCA